MFRGDTWTLFKKIGSVQRATAPKPRNKTFPRNLIIVNSGKTGNNDFRARLARKVKWVSGLGLYRARLLTMDVSPDMLPTLTMGRQFPENGA